MTLHVRIQSQSHSGGLGNGTPSTICSIACKALHATLFPERMYSAIIGMYEIKTNIYIYLKFHVLMINYIHNPENA